MIVLRAMLSFLLISFLAMPVYAQPMEAMEEDQQEPSVVEETPVPTEAPIKPEEEMPAAGNVFPGGNIPGNAAVNEENAVQEEGIPVPAEVEAQVEPAKSEPAQNAREIAEAYIKEKSPNGVLYIKDTGVGELRRLEWVKWHDDVKTVGENQVVCVEFKDKETEEVLDLDVEISQGKVVDLLIHKVGGVARYDYDPALGRVTAAQGT